MIASKWLMIGMACLLGASASGQEGTAITIYSSAQPGAVPPSLYRSGTPSYNPYRHRQQGIPGFAVVRHDRTLDLPGDAANSASPTWRRSSTPPRCASSR